MRKKIMKITIFSVGVLISLFYYSCATFSTPKILTLSFSEYALVIGSEEIQKKSDIEISMEVVRLSNVYNYPKLFSFNLKSLPTQYSNSPVLRSEYKPGLKGRYWEFPFASPDGKLQLLFCYCKIKNNTKHILRMGDARIYLIVEGVDPLPAITSLSEILEQADYFESIANQKRAQQTVLYVLQKSPIPTGFYRSIVLYNKKNYKLINDVNKEILPGFSYEGIFVFPVIPSFSSSGKVSFFDITTKVDSAGNPIEKTRFDFNLKRRYVRMWYDSTEKAWKVGTPPIQNK